MRKLATSELLQLRELLGMETIALETIKASEALVKDDELKTLVRSGVQAVEGRIKGLQQFIDENNIISQEVH